MQKVALVSRDAGLDLGSSRFSAVAAALDEHGLVPVLCRYDERRAGAVEAELMACAAALVWVNPVQDGRFRRALDQLLRRVAAAGVLVSAHPDVIDRMGVKAVLVRTRELGWSGDAHLYATPDELRRAFPERLRSGVRVLKQNRGNGGIGVWKVEAVGATVRVLEAAGGGEPQDISLQDFLAARIEEFDRVDGFVDQAFQQRIGEGMVRCYMAGDRLAGFGWQLVRALMDPSLGPAAPRTYSGPEDPRFQHLRMMMEAAWTPRLADILGLGRDDLPAIWDADFLFGPRDREGRDTFVLCEINVSSVHPIPDEAPRAIARTLAQRLAARLS